ncbi:MAG: DUF308 domain-containing protein [Brooklawnia sp.]|uniref:DUF308 domain-containing protein n=1 Tax=Brooklawnia sp. TaxID=2699740 RepID=UPI003C784128
MINFTQLSWPWLLVRGIIAIAFGVTAIVLVVPGLVLGAFVIMIAIAAIVWGVGSIIAALGLRSRVKQAEDAQLR